MSDQTPEARLTAALAKVPYQHPRLGTSELARSAPASVVVTRDEHIARSILAADPTLICPDPADHSLRDPFSVWQGVCGHLWRKVDDGEECPYCADLALAAAVRRLDSDNWGIVYDKGKFYVSNGDGQYSAGESTPTAAIQAAKEANDD